MSRVCGTVQNAVGTEDVAIFLAVTLFERHLGVTHPVIYIVHVYVPAYHILTE